MREPIGFPAGPPTDTDARCQNLSPSAGSTYFAFLFAPTLTGRVGHLLSKAKENRAGSLSAFQTSGFLVEAAGGSVHSGSVP
jgi:hypothetical protein